MTLSSSLVSLPFCFLLSLIQCVTCASTETLTSTQFLHMSGSLASSKLCHAALVRCTSVVPGSAGSHNSFTLICCIFSKSRQGRWTGPPSTSEKTPNAVPPPPPRSCR